MENLSNQTIFLQGEQVDDVVDILKQCITKVGNMADDLVMWDIKQYQAVPSEYVYMYPCPCYAISNINSCVDALNSVISQFNNIVDSIENYAASGFSSFEQGDSQVTEQTNGDGDGQLTMTMNPDGTYSDEYGNLYVRVGDRYIRVFSVGDNIYEDMDGNRYLAIDADGDGIAESFIQITDSDGDEYLTGTDNSVGTVTSDLVSSNVLELIDDGFIEKSSADSFKSDDEVLNELSASFVDVEPVIPRVNASKSSSGNMVSAGIAAAGGAVFAGGAIYGGIAGYRRMKEDDDDEEKESNEDYIYKKTSTSAERKENPLELKERFLSLEDGDC